FSSSDLCEGWLSRAIRAFFSLSAATIRLAYSSAFSASLSAASFSILLALGISSLMSADMIDAPDGQSLFSLLRKLKAGKAATLIQIKRTAAQSAHIVPVAQCQRGRSD